MRKRPEETDNLVDFTGIHSLKEFVTTANDRIFLLETALYDILETKRLDIAKEIAADVLEEDLEVYLEDDILEELDFDADEVYDPYPGSS